MKARFPCGRDTFQDNNWILVSEIMCTMKESKNSESTLYLGSHLSPFLPVNRPVRAVGGKRDGKTQGKNNVEVTARQGKKGLCQSSSAHIILFCRLILDKPFSWLCKREAEWARKER